MKGPRYDVFGPAGVPAAHRGAVSLVLFAVFAVNTAAPPRRPAVQPSQPEAGWDKCPSRAPKRGRAIKERSRAVPSGPGGPEGPERSRAVPSRPERSRAVPSGPERSRAVPSGPEWPQSTPEPT